MKSLNQVMKMKVPSMTLVSEMVCKGCSQPTKTFETEIIGGPRKGEKTNVTYGCICEDKELAKQAEKAHERRMKKKVQENFDYYSLISKRLRKANIDNFIPQNENQRAAKEDVIHFVNTFDIGNPVNILFTGGYGVGKSHLAKSLTDGVIAKGYSAIFISVPKLLRKIRSTYNRNSEISEDEMFYMLENVDVLVLDDLGAERQNDFSEEKIFDVIDSRQGMHTIYTSNYNANDLFKILGERNFSRVVNEDTKILEIEGKNHRLSDLY